MTFTIRGLLLAVFGLACVPSFLATRLQAQYASPPQTYSVIETNSMFVKGMTINIYRDGSKALMDSSYPPFEKNPKGFHVRTLYDLQARTQHTWDLLDTSVPCGAGAFSGNWGDPFAGSAQILGEDAKISAKVGRKETMNGIATKVLEAADPSGQGKAKIWVEEKYGLIVKWEITPPNGQPTTLLEVKELSLAKPPASLFVLPPACVNAPITSHSESTVGPEGEVTIHAEAQIGLPEASKETPGNTGDFVEAWTGSPSQNSCTVFFRIARADTMETITKGFRIKLNNTEVTNQMRDGILRIDNVAPKFSIAFDSQAGGGGAEIVRQCFRPETVLLFVVNSPEDVVFGSKWVWVKSGKFATVSAAPTNK